MAKVSAFFTCQYETEEQAIDHARILLASNQTIHDDRVTLDEDAGMSSVGGVTKSAATFEYACKLVCEGPVDLGRLMDIGFDFEVLG